MIGTDRCVYETPCHWCSKWDKQCDKKIGYQSRAMNAIYDVPTAYVMAVNEGEWICTECAYTWKCSVCGNEHFGTRTNFCSNCGAKMQR
jgi:hypothetical protein